MPDYKYEARSISGKAVKGAAAAVDETALAEILSAQGLFLISARERDGDTSMVRMKPKEISAMCRELGSMLSSGITLARAMNIMLRRDMKPAQRRVYESLYRGLVAGNTLSDAMKSLPGVFPELLINMFAAAEANGSMERTCLRMADHYEKEYKLRSKLRSAATYPLILLCLTIVVMLLVFIVVLPRFTSLYGDAELPALTRIVMAVADFITQDYLILLAVLLVLVFGFRALRSLPAFRRMTDKLKLRLPVFRKLLRTIYTARFTRTLSSLYASGLSIVSALQICAGTIGNSYIAAQFENLVRQVREGAALSTALEKVDGYDKKLPSTVLIGEESGRLEEMLLSLSDSFDYESEQATQRLSTMLEPILIVLMAVVICIVILAVMLPIYSMYDTMGV